MRRAIILLAGLAAIIAGTQLPPPEGLSQAGFSTLVLLIVMATFWFTETLPVAATALLPVLVLPLVGAGEMKVVAPAYMSDVIFLVLGASLLALAIEKWGLHRRVAVGVLKRSGTHPRGVVFAFILATAFVSMWISNTATALIMMPIAVAVVSTVLPQSKSDAANKAAFASALILGVSYAASIGGLGTLIGSPTNVIAAGILKRQLGLEITFLDWLAFGLPLIIVALPLTWLLLTRVSFRFHLADFDARSVISAIGEAGALTLQEKRLLPILALTVLAWLCNPLIKEILPGFEDATAAVLFGLSLFIIPTGKGGTLLDWADTRAAPWDVLLLYGGGLALADAITRTGLASWIGVQLSAIETAPLVLIVLAVVLLVLLVTEFASNVATAAGIIPVLAGVAATTGIDGMLLGMTAAMTASWGFMMPAGTAPNAIAFGTGYVRVPDMIRSGFLADLLGIALIPLAVWFGLFLLRL